MWQRQQFPCITVHCIFLQSISKVICSVLKPKKRMIEIRSLLKRNKIQTVRGVGTLKNRKQEGQRKFYLNETKVNFFPRSGNSHISQLEVISISQAHPFLFC